MPTTEKLKQEIADAEKKLAQERSRLHVGLQYILDN